MRSLPPVVLLVSLLVACSSPSYDRASKEWPRERRATMNEWIVRDYQDEQIQRGVIAMHTLYAHHFSPQRAELTELGERDVAILAAHYHGVPGVINIRRADASDDLYWARVANVSALLLEHGIDVDRIQIVDDLAGGDGLASDFVVRILEQKMDKPFTPDQPASSSVPLSSGAGM